MTLDQLMALALSDDPEQQSRAWDGLQSWNRTPERLRRLLTTDEIDARADPLARFVGVSAYAAAGGTVRRDLFSDDDNAGFLTDVTLLQTIAQDKLDAAVLQLQSTEAPAWVEAHALLDRYRLPPDFVHAPLVRRDPTEVEAQALAAVEGKLGALHAQWQALDEDEGEQVDVLQRSIAVLEEKIDALVENRLSPEPRLQGLVGALVGVDEDGILHVVRNVLRRAGCKISGRVASPSEPTRANPASPRSPFSERLFRQLSAHRTSALQWTVANRPDVALAVLAYTLAGLVFRTVGVADGGVHIGITPARPESDAPDIANNPAFACFSALRERIAEELPAEAAESRRTERGVDLLKWCLAQPQETLLRLVAFCVAASLDDSQRVPDDRHAATKLVFRHLGVDMADCWTPTAEGFLSLVSKAQIVTALTEAGVAASTDATDNKVALVAAAEKRLAGARWLPMPLRPPGV